jgi:hypothetical protein
MTTEKCRGHLSFLLSKAFIVSEQCHSYSRYLIFLKSDFLKPEVPPAWGSVQSWVKFASVIIRTWIFGYFKAKLLTPFTSTLLIKYFKILFGVFDFRGGKWHYNRWLNAEFAGRQRHTLCVITCTRCLYTFGFLFSRQARYFMLSNNWAEKWCYTVMYMTMHLLTPNN